MLKGKAEQVIGLVEQQSPTAPVVQPHQGQITIPAYVRQALQVKAGERVEFLQSEPGRSEIVAATRPVPT
jgi:AbrB family looped-hinge helix DNA binding protein